jgi:hypothetical protein
MIDPRDTEDRERADRPGKTRTWWHPLLARLLDYELATAYAVRDEVLVGKLPLRVDILLIRRESGELPETSRRDLGVLLPLLNRFTLIEFKEVSQFGGGFSDATRWHGILGSVGRRAPGRAGRDLC